MGIPPPTDKPGKAPVATDGPAGLILDDATVARMQRNLGRALFAARWIMAPVYIGLLAAMVLIVIKFGQ